MTFFPPWWIVPLRYTFHRKSQDFSLDTVGHALRKHFIVVQSDFWYLAQVTIFLTIFAGVMTFVLGQLALKLLIDPVQEFKRAVADISHALIEYAEVYENPGITGRDKEREVSKELKRLSSRLNAQMYLIPMYKNTARIFRLPTRGNVVKAEKDLIGLSNGLSPANPEQSTLNRFTAYRIFQALGIYIPEKERLSPEDEEKFLRG